MSTRHIWTERPVPGVPLTNRYYCECGAWTNAAHGHVWYSNCPLRIVHDREEDLKDLEVLAKRARVQLTDTPAPDVHFQMIRVTSALARLTLEAEGRFSYEGGRVRADR